MVLHKDSTAGKGSKIKTTYNRQAEKGPWLTCKLDVKTDKVKIKLTEENGPHLLAFTAQSNTSTGV